jgi:broad specificity phosphatase PhoE
MSKLIVVRHGQASFLADDYDKLSELGWEQARQLGRYWASQDLIPTRIVVGPRIRHEESAEAIMDEMGRAGKRLPEPVHDSRLDEFDWDGLKRYADSTLSKKDKEISELKAAFELSESPDDKRRTVQHYIEAIMARWVAGAFHEEGLETWAEFCGRVEASMRAQSADAPRGSRVVLISSGGVAAVSAGRVLGLSAEKTLSLTWTLRNGAFVEYLFHATKISLSGFNNAPHLLSSDMWSYR